MLLLAESAAEQVFQNLPKLGSCGRWVLASLDTEPQTVIASFHDREIAIVCGRQIRCKHGLEVLALGTTTRYPEGHDARDTIERVRGDGAIAVFPWGFGKWMGRARDTVEELFDTPSPKSFFVGDNGGRLRLMGVPMQLEAASRDGFRVLPGTDPFPFGRDYRRVGSFGFLANLVPDSAHPWRSLRDWLESESGFPEPYGDALGPFRFAFNQSWIQVRNRVLQRGAP